MGLRIGIGIGIGFSRNIPPPKVKFDLLENGLDFITEAIETINASSNYKKLKYALIHLCSGVELIFKEILRNKDWRLIFQEPKDATAELLQSGNFESVSFKKAIIRLESNCNIKFSIEDLKILEDFRNKRNKIEHFKVDEQVSTIRGISSKVLIIIIQLIHQKIEIEKVSPLSRKFINNLPKELSKFNIYVAEQMKTIKTKQDENILKGLTLIKCPNCYQNTFFIDSKLKCLFCNYTNTPEIIATEICRVNNGDSTLSPLECNNCSSVTVIRTETKSICVKCRKIINNETTNAI